MGRLIRWIIYICALGAVSLVVYAYAGPFFGADFSPTREEVRQPVILDAN